MSLSSLFRVLLVLVALASSTLSSAASLSPDQLKFLRQLNPQQRAAMLKALGGQADGQVQQADQPLSAPQVVAPQAPAGESAGDSATARDKTIRGGSTLIVKLAEPEPEPTAADRANEAKEPLSGAVTKLLGDTVFTVGQDGVLSLPGIDDIAVGGLTADQAAERLSAEPAFKGLVVDVTLLPVKPVGPAALKPFGYDLFSGVPTTFAPATDIPVPADYVIGPGDTVQVQLFGKDNSEYSLVVSRDGVLNFPGLGPVPVSGLSFTGMQKDLQQRIAEQMIGVKASITMGPLRSIRVFVLGDARRPGSYTVSALSTMTNALFVSGGIDKIGSLRNIELKRRGRVVTHLDLYDLLLHGDTSHDTRLLPGDVIFIPPVGDTVGVSGEVKRPAIYELKHENTVEQVVKLAGGLLPQADPKVTQLERVDAAHEHTLLDVDLGRAKGRSMHVRDGDVVRVYSVLSRVGDVVTLAGHVERPGKRQWHRGMRLTDLIPSADDLRAQADMHYVLIRRELPPDRKVKVFSADLAAALLHPESNANVALRPRDKVLVFGLDGDRGDLIKPILAELRLQSDRSTPDLVVSIGGRVRAPGQYPLERGMRVSDLIRAAGQLRESAYTLGAEVTRYKVVNGQYRATEHIPVDLGAALAGNAKANVVLQPHDFLNIRDIPRWSKQQSVEVRGEVRFPGKYPIQRGETLSDVVKRAGGLTDLAYPEGAVFLREDLREKEQKQMDALASRLEANLASAQLELAQDVQGNKNQAQAYQIGKALVSQLRNTKAAGRLVIDLNAILNGKAKPRKVGSDDTVYLDRGVSEDVLLRNGDKLYVPRRPQSVTIIGEVHYPTSHLYHPGWSRDDYIEHSGGLTQKADKKHIYVVRANGSVIASKGSFWTLDEEKNDIRPGDTIVVPLDAERIRPLTLWTNVTQILYHIGVAVAAFHSASIF